MGEIRAPGVIIDGAVQGDVYASRLLQLASKAQVSGNVFYAEAEMSAGAQVNGQFQHVADKAARASEEPAAPQLVSNKTGKGG